MLKVVKYLSSIRGGKQVLIEERHNKYQKSIPRAKVEKTERKKKIDIEL